MISISLRDLMWLIEVVEGETPATDIVERLRRRSPEFRRARARVEKERRQIIEECQRRSATLEDVE
jgi:3-hydroxyacyl-CoA dehydrogenase